MMQDLFGEDTLTTLRRERAPRKKAHRRTTECIDIPEEEEYRRAFGVQQLIKVMGVERPQAGHSYHIISGGNVDLIAHLRWLMVHWPHFCHVFISAWAISITDILLLKRWHEDGRLGDISILVGDIYPNGYKQEWKKLMEYYDEGIIRNLYSSAIHSKLLLIEVEPGGDCIVVESSANCNKNPRVEQSVVTLSRPLYEFYYNYMMELFEKELWKRTTKDLMKLETYEPCTIPED